jgi:ribosomal protein S18 acetylase RimI-like enzyme
VQIEHLDWDTSFFGFEIGRLQLHAPVPDMAAIPTMASEQGYKLVYLIVPDADAALNAQAAVLAPLVDIKDTYAAPVSSTGHHTDPAIVEYTSTIAVPELIQLALDAGVYSRFHRDALFPRGGFEALYRQWIINSVNRTIADQILVYKVDDQIAGFTTIRYQPTHATIGLVAVAAGYRGRGIGRALIAAVQAHTTERGIATCRVATQRDNQDACRLYEKAGFHLEHSERYYHIWIK